ncbi:hypothetical protein [Kineococcus rubinsiae]|uniref:hypothetical protein n=1 Tax=Kineococcus rubinsiae TaxID=2609562 RepID=UPI0014308C05|nr:hypothetical protein [Kineococcus rubinsiae]NIZ91764.1 hypothetical protein [Kineococcus rubinsiae]
MNPVIRVVLDTIAAHVGLIITTAPDVREATLVQAEEQTDSPHLQCPHCAAIDTLAEVDRSTPYNTLVDLDYGLDGHSEDLSVGVSEDDHNYTTDHFECTDCNGHVTIPSAVEVCWG